MAQVEIKLDISRGSKFDEYMREWLRSSLAELAEENPTNHLVSRIAELQQRIEAVLMYLEEAAPCDPDHIRALLSGGK